MAMSGTWYEDIEKEESVIGDTCSSQHPSNDRIRKDLADSRDTSYSDDMLAQRETVNYAAIAIHTRCRRLIYC